LFLQGEERPEVGAGEVADVLQVDDHLVRPGLGDGAPELLGEVMGQLVPLQPGGGQGQHQDASLGAGLQVPEPVLRPEGLLHWPGARSETPGQPARESHSTAPTPAHHEKAFGLGVRDRGSGAWPIDTLARWILESEHLVPFTGAGISTDSGIPDFRGPDGVGSRRDAGLPAPRWRVPPGQVESKASHRALAELQRPGKLRFLLTQNTDDLHRRSGIWPDLLAELHGNGRLMRCVGCDRQLKQGGGGSVSDSPLPPLSVGAALSATFSQLT
jgi:hypothetical protein